MRGLTGGRLALRPGRGGLTVGRQAIGWVYVMIGRADMDALGASPGDVVEVEGRRRTAARCVPSPPHWGRGEFAAGVHVRDNMRADGTRSVYARRIEAPAARSVELVPLDHVPPADSRYLRDALHGMPLAAGDRVSVVYGDSGFMPYRGRGPGGTVAVHLVKFQVASVAPAGGAAVAARSTSLRADAGRRAVPPPLRLSGRLAADVRRLRAAIGPALGGRGAGRQGGAVVYGDSGYGETLAYAAAGAAGAHYVTVREPSLVSYMREHSGRSGLISEMADLVAGSHERIIDSALEKAPSVVAYTATGGGGPAAAYAMRMLGRRGAARRVALVAVAHKPDMVPPEMAGLAGVRVGDGGAAARRRRARAGG